MYGSLMMPAVSISTMNLALSFVDVQTGDMSPIHLARGPQVECPRPFPHPVRSLLLTTETLGLCRHHSLPLHRPLLLQQCLPQEPPCEHHPLAVYLLTVPPLLPLHQHLVMLC